MRKSTWTAMATMLLIAVAVIAAESTEKVGVELTKEQEQAAAKVREAGGMVLRVAGNSPDLDVAFHLSGKEGVDKALPFVIQLPGVTKLNLAGTDVTDEGLAHLKALKDLTHLHLERTKITDKGLAHLKGLAKLEYLNLYGTEVTDAGLEQLKGLKSLKKLYLWQSKATKEGAAKLAAAIKGLYVNTGWEPAPVAAVEDKPEEVTIAVIMQKAHKGDDSLLAAAVGGGANDEQKKQLLAFYHEMAKLKPGKGDEKSWQEKTKSLIEAADLLVKGDGKAVEMLKQASNCKTCHSVHK